MVSPTLAACQRKHLSCAASDISDGSTASAATQCTKPSKASAHSLFSFSSRATRSSSASFLGAPRGAVFGRGLSFRQSRSAPKMPSARPGLEVGDLCEAVATLSVRSGESLESEKLMDFPAGTAMVVQQVGVGRRIQVRAACRDLSLLGVEGWVSSRTAADELLVIRCSPDLAFAAADFDIGGCHEIKVPLKVLAREAEDSQVVSELQPGHIARIVDLGRVNRRRAKVLTADGATGWVSVVTPTGEPTVGKIESGKAAAPSASGARGIDAQAKQKALLDAVMAGDYAAVRKIVEPATSSIFFRLKQHRHACDINVADRRGKTPLIYAAAFGHADIVQLLLRHAADVHAVDDTQKSALHHAARSGGNMMPGLCDRDASDEIVRLLLSGGARIDEVDHSGCTPMMVAVANGHAAIARALLSAGADLAIQDRELNCALDYAFHFGHSDLVVLLGSGSSETALTEERLRAQLAGAASLRASGVAGAAGAAASPPCSAVGSEASAGFIAAMPSSEAASTVPDDAASAAEVPSVISSSFKKRGAARHPKTSRRKSRLTTRLAAGPDEAPATWAAAEQAEEEAALRSVFASGDDERRPRSESKDGCFRMKTSGGDVMEFRTRRTSSDLEAYVVGRLSDDGMGASRTCPNPPTGQDQVGGRLKKEVGEEARPIAQQEANSGLRAGTSSKASAARPKLRRSSSARADGLDGAAPARAASKAALRRASSRSSRSSAPRPRAAAGALAPAGSIPELGEYSGGGSPLPGLGELSEIEEAEAGASVSSPSCMSRASSRQARPSMVQHTQP